MSDLDAGPLSGRRKAMNGVKLPPAPPAGPSKDETKPDSRWQHPQEPERPS